MTRPAAVGRAARLKRQRNQDHVRQAVFVVLALVVGAAIALSSSPRPHHIVEEPTDADGGPSLSTNAMRTTLIMHQSSAKIVDFLVVLGIDLSAQRATLIFVPSKTVVEVPGLGLQPLRDLMKVADLATLTTTVENSLGIRIDTATQLSDRSVTKMLGSSTQHLFERSDDATLQHFATAQSVLTSWFDRLRAHRALKQLGLRDPSLNELVALADYGGGLAFETLPVASVEAGSDTRFEIRDSDVAALVKEKFAGARLGIAGVRPRVELLNAVGTPGLVGLVAARIVPEGGEVRLSGNASRFGETTTKVVYYRDNDAKYARRFARILGAGTVAKGTSPMTVVDITIVIGTDITKILRPRS